MQWISMMNNAIDYVEIHIREEVDFTQAARIAYSSLSRFQRMFSFVTDMTISEYVRSRRMALSAEELMGSDIKIKDLALKYGYESPEAFTRAFKQFHGVSPTSTRKLGIHIKYPRITFQLTINEGNFIMGTKPLLRIEEHSKERVVSFSVNCRAPEESAWNLLRKWVMSNLQDYSVRRYIGCAPKGHHSEGEKHHTNEDIGSHEYMAQMFLLGNEGEQDTFLGAEVCDAPYGLYLVGDVVLNEFNDDGSIDIGTSMEKAYFIMAECLKDIGGYEFELEDRLYFEEHVFPQDWFTGGNGLNGFKLWLPVKKA